METHVGDPENSPCPEAIRFLRQLRPDGPWTLIAMPIDLMIRAPVATFDDSTIAECEKWLARYNGVHNILVMLNVPREHLEALPHAEDVEAIQYEYVEASTARGASKYDVGYLENCAKSAERAPTFLVHGPGCAIAIWRIGSVAVEGDVPAILRYETRATVELQKVWPKAKFAAAFRMPLPGTQLVRPATVAEPYGTVTALIP